MIILDDLIHQFADPFAFFRELVQNAIDSGTGEVEIETRHRDGVGAVVVRDWGEGMSREIIESKLVRLFASTKDDDLTKIGRFGIGFVSVFAIDPDQVVLDTGRSGEYWRVVFGKDRSYELFHLDEPREGTEVRLLKTMTDDEFQAFRQKAESALYKWCRFAETPIVFDGRPVEADFTVDSPCKVRFRKDGTRVIMGMADEGQGFSGYYNRGLTLIETSKSPWPWVKFRIDSPLLEHTLTRDELLWDRHLARATGLLAQMATDDIPGFLMTRLEELARGGTQVDYEIHLRFLKSYLVHQKEFPKAWRKRPFLRDINGQVHSAEDAHRALAELRLMLTAKNGALARELLQPGHLVLHGGLALQEVLREILVQSAPSCLETQFLLLEELRAADVEAASPLKESVQALFAAIDIIPDEVLFVEPASLYGEKQQTTAVFRLPTGRGPIQREAWQAPLGSGTTVVFNLAHDVDGQSLMPLVELAIEEPEWAGLALVDSLAVTPGVDPRLLEEARRRRRARLRSARHPTPRDAPLRLGENP